MLASKLGDSVAGLGNNAKPEAITEFSAKAHAPNHRKITRALAFNAELSGATSVASGGRPSGPGTYYSDLLAGGINEARSLATNIAAYTAALAPKPAAAL
ncbi:hypothetical protein GCM10011533_14440 [Streptosporangium jomthongense]|nr:hypothetical protein GCM10011533_14440 [Streptosporangium jomthongense]